MYVAGLSFQLETDHKPLERIYSCTSKRCARIERWVLRLQGFNFKVVYRPGKTNIADALSRLNSVEQVDHGEEYDFVRVVVESCVPAALTLNEIEEASYNDEELCLVKNCVRSGNLGTVYAYFVCTRQGRTMHLWQAFTLWHKDSGSQSFVRQGAKTRTRGASG